MRPLYKTTIIIWSKEDPYEKYELVDLAKEATDGSMYCTVMISERIENPAEDKDWDGSDFFGEEDEER